MLVYMTNNDVHAQCIKPNTIRALPQANICCFASPVTFFCRYSTNRQSRTNINQDNMFDSFLFFIL